MPNIRSQIVGPLGAKAPSGLPGDQVGLYIQASDGHEVTITRADIFAQWQAATGTVPQRVAIVLAWVRAQIETVLGTNQITANRIISQVDGSPDRLDVTS